MKNKETLEEFIKVELEGYDERDFSTFERFITLGAKWQADRMYSEEEPKQETLDELGTFAERKYLERVDNFQKCDFKDGVFEGAKWQAERMYKLNQIHKK
jgi:hypothetical protein